MKGNRLLILVTKIIVSNLIIISFLSSIVHGASVMSENANFMVLNSNVSEESLMPQTCIIELNRYGDNLIAYLYVNDGVATSFDETKESGSQSTMKYNGVLNNDQITGSFYYTFSWTSKCDCGCIDNGDGEISGNFSIEFYSNGEFYYRHTATSYNANFILTGCEHHSPSQRKETTITNPDFESRGIWRLVSEEEVIINEAGTLPANFDFTTGNNPDQDGSNSSGSAPGSSMSGTDLSAGALFTAVGLTALITLFGSVGVALTNGMSLQGLWSEFTAFFGNVIPGNKVELPLEAEQANYPEESVVENPALHHLSTEEEEIFWRQVEEDSILIPELEKKIAEIEKQKLRAEKEFHNLSQYYAAGPDEASTFPHLKEGEAYRIMPDPFRGREGGNFDLANAREQKIDQLNQLEQEEAKLKIELKHRNPHRYIIRELPEIFEQIHDLERQKELLSWEKYITEKRRDAGPFGPGKITKNAADEIINRVERGLIEADLKLEKLRQTRSASLDKLQKGSRNDLYALLKEETDQKVKSLELTKALLKEVGTESYYDKTHYYDQEWLDLKVKEINKQIEELINN